MRDGMRDVVDFVDFHHSSRLRAEVNLGINVPRNS